MSKHREEPTVDEELNELCEKLWDLDENRLVPDKDYDLDLQGRTRFSYDGPDRASDPLFASVAEDVFQRPTYKAFIALLDNYESETGVAESVTPQEEAENRRFIDLVVASPCMKEAHKFLVKKGKSPPEIGKFKWQLYNLWFKLYRRTRGNRNQDSSGFEHVFVGETRGDKEVIGFHNWIQFYLQEKKGNIDYKGFMSSDRNPHLLTIQFAWRGEVKPKGSTFIGTSPEFEFTLYSACYLMGYESTDLTLGSEHIIITCHRMANSIGSSYPIAKTWGNARK